MDVRPMNQDFYYLFPLTTTTPCAAITTTTQGQAAASIEKQNNKKKREKRKKEKNIKFMESHGGCDGSKFVHFSKNGIKIHPHVKRPCLRRQRLQLFEGESKKLIKFLFFV